jgi:hypothetical protein
MMIGYDIYDHFTMEHFPLCQDDFDDQFLLLATVYGQKLIYNKKTIK